MDVKLKGRTKELVMLLLQKEIKTGKAAIKSNCQTFKKN